MSTIDYKFILISFNDIDIYTKERISDLFSSLFEISPIKNENYLLFELYNEKANKDYHLKEIFNVLKEDFNNNIYLFESNVLEDKSNQDELINIYQYNKINDYTDISKLCGYLLENNSKLLFDLKKIILYKVYQDNDLLNIINAMFKNNLNVSKTSDMVYMHRNTVIKKLDIIEKKTGLNMQNFNDAVIMYLLLSLDKK